MSDAIRPFRSSVQCITPPVGRQDGSDAGGSAVFLDLLGLPDAPDPLQSASLTLGDDGKSPAELTHRTSEADARYNVPLAKSDHAVAFDARAVVAPAAMATATEATATVVQADLPVAPPTDPILRSRVGGWLLTEAGTPERDRAPAISACHVSGLFSGPALPVRTAPPVTNAPSQPSGDGDRPVAEKSFSPDMVDAAEPGYSAETETSRPTTNLNQSRSAMLARLLASDNQYRLVVRGNALEPKEIRGIRRAIASLLRAFGLPEKPVQINWQGRSK